MKKKLSKELSARTEAESSTKANGKQVSPTNAKPRVIGSQSSPASLEEAIVALSSKETLADLKTFLDFVMFCLKNVDCFCEWFDEKYKSKEFSIVARIGDGYYVDLGQVRVLYSLMSSNNKVVSPPSESKTTVN